MRRGGMDRTFVEKSLVEGIDRDVKVTLRLLSPYLLQAPAGKIIEWLVRRFRFVFL